MTELDKAIEETLELYRQSDDPKRPAYVAAIKAAVARYVVRGDEKPHYLPSGKLSAYGTQLEARNDLRATQRKILGSAK